MSKEAFVHNLETYCRRYQNKTGFEVAYDLRHPKAIDLLMDSQKGMGFTPGSRSGAVYLVACEVLRLQQPPLNLTRSFDAEIAAKFIGAAFYDVRHGHLRLIDDELFARLCKRMSKYISDRELMNHMAMIGVEIIKGCMPQSSANR